MSRPRYIMEGDYCYVQALPKQHGVTLPNTCPRCESSNLKDKGSFEKCLACGLRIIPDFDSIDEESRLYVDDFPGGPPDTLERFSQ